MLLANVPPQRFNYQQRVGRAGRRGDPLSVALTVCRDRTHDGYYFEHPEGMTTAAPPAPYHHRSRTDLPDLAVRDLPTVITDIANLPDEQPDLSQRLAEHGLLPMFGFPTQTRHLYLHEPRRSHPWPPEESVDRDLRLAISEFAPGNEIVREKIVLTPLGLAGFRPTGMTPRAVPALGPVTPVGLCEVSGAIDPAPSQACGECGAQAPDFRIEQLSRPAGFRTRGRPLTGNPTKASASACHVHRRRNSRPPACTGTASTPPTACTSAAPIPRSGRSMTTADAASSLHRPTTRTAATSSPTSFPPGWTAGPPVPHVLGAMYTTDVLVAGPQQQQGPAHSHLLYPQQGGRAQLISTARPAAWASLAFAIRARAAVTVDVEPRELEAGVRLTAATGGAFAPQISSPTRSKTAQDSSRTSPNARTSSNS